MITRLLPSPQQDLDEEALLEAYRFDAGERPRVRFNFVASADGAATLRGRAGGLGNDADQRILQLLRRTADVLVLGAGTVRAEGYGGALLEEPGLAWRREHGAAAHPAVAIVSASLDLDPAAPFFAEAPVRPTVFGSASAPREARSRLAEVADVVVLGDQVVDPAEIVAELASRGHRRILSEGGPRLFGSFQQAGLVDELCLTVSPLLVGGPNPRIAQSALEHAAPLPLALVHVLLSEDLLFLRYRLAAEATSREGTAT